MENRTQMQDVVSRPGLYFMVIFIFLNTCDVPSERKMKALLSQQAACVKP